MKKYNTPHRHRVIKTRLTEEEYAEFSERVTLCKMSVKKQETFFLDFLFRIFANSGGYPVAIPRK